jgi:DNA-binding response OmpR family regulator
MNSQKILVVEDEPDILELISYNLGKEGFDVVAAEDGETGLQRARSDSPDLVLLDLMLPRMDGLEVCRALKQDDLTRNISIIMVTAKGEESDVVLGLGLGADDYITKPFRPKELVARTRAVLRRGQRRQESGPSERIEEGPLVIDTARHCAAINGRELGLTATEFRLLAFLASHPGRVFTRDQLINHVLGQLAAVTPRNIDVHIRSIRKKLEDERELIETIRGVGYRFREL